MATPASIAARREVALQRIVKALGFKLSPVKGVAEFRHACELEQIADELDPEGRAPAPAPDHGAMREAPFTRHEDANGDGGSSPTPEANTAAVAVAPVEPAAPPPDAQPQRNPDHAREQRPRRIHGRR